MRLTVIVHSAISKHSEKSCLFYTNDFHHVFLFKLEKIKLRLPFMHLLFVHSFMFTNHRRIKLLVRISVGFGKGTRMA